MKEQPETMKDIPNTPPKPRPRKFSEPGTIKEKRQRRRKRRAKPKTEPVKEPAGV